MEAHNIDFARRIELQEKTNKKNTKSSKVSWYFIIFFIGFSLGVYTGFQLFKLKHLEETLVKNPDKLPQDITTDKETNESFNTTSAKDYKEGSIEYSNVSNPEGDYIIYLGKFNAKYSSEIIKYLKNKDVFKNKHFYPCKHLEEYSYLKENPILYQIPTEKGKYHKIIIGCFLSEEEAKQFLDIIVSLDKDIFKNSEIYHLKE